MLKKTLFVASIILILSYVGTLITLLNFPIYPDEIASRIWLARLGYDFPMRINLYPACQSYLQSLAMIWYIPGLIEWVLHGFISNLHTLRGMGILFNAVIIVMLAYCLVRKMLLEKGQKFQSSYIIAIGLGTTVSLISLGVLPAFLVTNRQEQILLFCLVILLMFVDFASIKTLSKNLLATITITIFFLCTSLMLYVHPKALFLTPVYFYIGYHLFSKLSSGRLILLMYLMLIAQLGGNFYAWNTALDCSQAPEVDTFIKSFNINPFDFSNNMSNLFRGLKQSIRDMPKILSQITFQAVSEVNYLPSLIIQNKELIVNFFIRLNYSLMLILLTAGLLYRYYGDVLKSNYYSRNLLFLLLLSCAGGTILLSITKSWYDVGYFWAVIGIIIIFFVSDSFDTIVEHVGGQIVILYCIFTAIFSLLIFNVDYRNAFINGYTGPGIFLSKYNYAETLSDYKAIAEACSLNLKNSSGLVLDDYTYLYFKESKYPMLITYINYHTDTNIVPRLIKEAKIKAIVVRCSSMAAIPNLKKESVLRSGDVCCYPESKIHELK